MPMFIRLGSLNFVLRALPNYRVSSKLKVPRSKFKVQKSGGKRPSQSPASISTWLTFFVKGGQVRGRSICPLALFGNTCLALNRPQVSKERQRAYTPSP